MKKVIVVTVGSLYKVPPVISLLNGLVEQNVSITLITTEDGIDSDDALKEKIEILKISETYESKVPSLFKLFRMIKIRKHIWELIASKYDSESILWILSDATVKNLGRKLLKYRYVLQLYELVEKRYLISNIKIGDIHLDRFARSAIRVVVPEYNRAHITKAWWGLEKMPFVLENKPYYSNVAEKRNAEITHSMVAKNIIDSVKNKKIILYQGIVHKERPLDAFMKAIEMLGDDYVFIVMSNGDDPFEGRNIKNYFFIPHIQAPYHLEITSHAYIGVLSYVPTKTSNSILNAVYCAPNKTFEYSRFGIPMISNDVPALMFLFNDYKCGICVDGDDSVCICEAIKTIDRNYSTFSINSLDFYSNTDYVEKIKKILEEIFA